MKKHWQKINVLATVFLGIITAMPLVSLAQNPGSTIGQHLKAGDLGIDFIGPASFNFTPIDISSPYTKYNSYFFNPNTPENRIQVHDGRYDGGFQLQVQASDYIEAKDPAKKIEVKNLAIVTEAGIIAEKDSKEAKENPLQTLGVSGNETVMTDTPSLEIPLNGIAKKDETYTSFIDNKTPINALYAGACAKTQGRVGSYTFYPSYRLTIPNNTPEGTYASTITWTIIDESLNC